MSSRALVVSLFALVVAFLGWSWWMGSRQDPLSACGAGTVAGGAIGGPLSLVDETGRRVSEADLFQTPALVYFGYSFCPDVCPLDNVRNAEALDLLQERGIEAAAYFVSVDPDRDTPDVMADYTDLIHPRLVGLTGDAEQVKAAASAYKVIYRKHEDEGEYYMVDHTTFTYLMLPGGQFAGFFKRDDSAAAVAERAACLIAASAG